MPKAVGNAARLLSDRADAYVFFSTVSVYPAWPAEPVSEENPVYECAPDASGTAEDEATWTAAQYGAYKAGCERAVLDAFNGRVTVLRPGVVLGPQENVGRLVWWLRRIERVGRVLAPGDATKPIQPVDIRDLAAFTLKCLEKKTVGIFNVVAPQGQATFGRMLDACVAETESGAQLTWVDDDFLIDHQVRQWTEIPLWRTPPGTWSVDTDKAAHAGLTCRPIEGTVRDTYGWLSKSGDPAAYDRQAHHGLSQKRERELLEIWDRR